MKMPYDKFLTLNQFYSVMIYTCLIAGLCFSVMYHYYGLDKKKRNIIVSSLVLLFSYLSSFICPLATSYFTYRFFYLSAYSLRLIHLLSSFFIFRYLIENKKRQYRAKNISLFLAYIILSISSLLFFNPYLSVDVLILLHFIVLLNYFIDYRFSMDMFFSVSKNLQNFVFVLDSKGLVIYKNTLVQKSNFFVDRSLFDVNNLDSFFSGEVKIREYHGNNFIKNEEGRVFSESKKIVYSRGGKLAYIFTFIDVTTLFDLLDELEKKKDSINSSNKKLLKNKNKVYEMERRKEILSLLDEISSMQEKRMYDLKGKITKIDLGDEDFLERISLIIEEAKLDLKKVRELVSLYREA